MANAIKSNSVMTCSVLDKKLVWTFADGSKLEFDPARCNQAMRDIADFHGFKQKIGDKAAIGRNKKTGKSATLAEKKAKMQAIVDSLYAGQWNMPAGGGNEGGMLLEALVRTKPEMSESNIIKWLKTLDNDQKEALRNTATLKPVIDEIRAERAKTSAIDGDALLNGFLAEQEELEEAE